VRAARHGGGGVVVLPVSGLMPTMWTVRCGSKGVAGRWFNADGGGGTLMIELGLGWDD
jgi:hypothetical protein